MYCVSVIYVLGWVAFSVYVNKNQQTFTFSICLNIIRSPSLLLLDGWLGARAADDDDVFAILDFLFFDGFLVVDSPHAVKGEIVLLDLPSTDVDEVETEDLGIAYDK